MFLTRENIFWKVKNGWTAVKTNWLIFFNALMSKHIWPTEIVRGTRSNDLDGFFLCAYVIQNLKIFILRQSMPVFLENKELLPKSFFRWKWPILVKFWKIHFSSWKCIKNSCFVENVYFSKTSLLRVKILKSILRRLTPGFWKFSNRSYSRVYRYIRQCVYICFRYLDGGRWLSINLYLW